MMALAPRTVQNMPDCFRRRADHGLAAGLDDPGANEQVLLAELGIAHAGRIPFEVVGFDANLIDHLGIGGVDGAYDRYEFFDFPFVEQTLLVEFHPGLLARFVIGV